MSVWEESYRLVAESVPDGCREILDLGCGTRLELDWIWKKRPDIEVTGVDLCRLVTTKTYITELLSDNFQFPE